MSQKSTSYSSHKERSWSYEQHDNQHVADHGSCGDGVDLRRGGGVEWIAQAKYRAVGGGGAIHRRDSGTLGLKDSIALERNSQRWANGDDAVGG